MENNTWKKALKILNQNGYEAYLVGGAVRDHLLKIEPHDFDITTAAKPATIKALFKDYKILTIGEKHGTITVYIEGTPLEITTYRSDLNYQDHRHPTNVDFISDINEDLKRRDFTINALIMDENEQVFDLVDGQIDLNNHWIRAIGEPSLRFQEDALRILRGIRLASQYGFEIVASTQAAMFKQAHLLKNISKERIAEEFLKIVKNEHLEVLDEYQLIFKPLIAYSYQENKLTQTKDFILRLALLFEDNPSMLKQLFLSKETRNAVLELINHRDKNNLIVNFSAVHDLKRYLNYLQILYGHSFEQSYQEALPYIVNRQNLAISNQELINYGYCGPALGKISEDLIKAIHARIIPNDHEAIIKLLKKKG